jgi:hypothetical protein
MATDLFDDMVDDMTDDEDSEELSGMDTDGDDENAEIDDESPDDSNPAEEPQEYRPANSIVPQGKQGVFADRDSVFDTKRAMDRRNPVVTRAEETANELLPARLPVSTKAQLVAVFDAQGRPFVAYHQNGRALEKFRLPTPQEFEVLRSRGQLVKGGLGEAPDAAPAAPVTPAQQAATSNKTWLYVGAAAVAVGGLAWWYMNKQKKGSAPRKNADDADDAHDDADDTEE